MWLQASSSRSLPVHLMEAGRPPACASRHLIELFLTNRPLKGCKETVGLSTTETCQVAYVPSNCKPMDWYKSKLPESLAAGL